MAFEDLQDPYGIKFWPKFKGRDGCRTPMSWTSNAPHGGFSTAKPWLPLAAEHAARSVDALNGTPGSMLEFYRRMIAYRKQHP
ncbi:alpha-glucosidase, partial [bacterium LRH843]|nr:alpha-glucosidase [bacterium LRH843]